jgi:hypothetical protein
MATPILNQVSIDLAYKLQDPVSSGTGDGTRLSADERFRYIIRAYRRLLRMVMGLYPDLMQKIFHDFYASFSGTSGTDGRITTLTDWSEVFEVFCKETTDEDYVRASFVSPEDYLKVKHEENPFYAGDLNTDKYFWTRRSDDIYLLPAVQLSFELSYRPDKAKIIEDEGQGGAFDLDMATEYLDLLLSLACAEAYLDINQVDSVNAYNQDVASQLSLLAGLSNKMDIKDETNNP